VVELEDKLIDRCYSCGYERLTELRSLDLVGVAARHGELAAGP